jgi:tetratricopeptide (TPR) repeat protein
MKPICTLVLIFYSLISFAQTNKTTAPTTQYADSLFTKSNWQAAINAYEAVLKTDTGNVRLWYNVAQAYQQVNQYNKAIDAYNKSLSNKNIAMPRGIIRSNQAKIYSLTKDSTKALNLLTTMIGNGYSNSPDMKKAPEYAFVRQTARFKALTEKARLNAYPCISNPQNHEFDFWIGEWDVYQTNTNYQVGKEKVEQAAGQCMIIENWIDITQPNDGKSMNFINPKTQKWEQVWMGSGGVYLNYYNGVYKDGAMRFESDATDKAGNKTLFHFTFFNQGPKQLRQLLEQSVDGGINWTIVYDLTYKRIVKKA